MSRELKLSIALVGLVALSVFNGLLGYMWGPASGIWALGSGAIYGWFAVVWIMK